MAWIRNFEKLEKETSKDKNYVNYEIKSECNIAGLLRYNDEKLLCGPLGHVKGEDGLRTYIVRLQIPDFEVGSYKQATKKGYFYKGGVVGEFMVLFSLFLRCRFYLDRSISGELSSTSIPIMLEHPIPRVKVHPISHPAIFDQKGVGRNFASKIPQLLDQVKCLPVEIHQDFILAGSNYLKALREIGIEGEMVFVRLVSAIEPLSKKFKLKRKDDMLSDLDIDDLLSKSRLNTDQKNEIKQILEVRKAKKKFIRFLEHYSKGYFKGGGVKNPRTRIYKRDLAKIAGRIYDARSAFLHAGEPMYLSRLRSSGSKAHTEGSLGMTIDQREFGENQKMPFTDWFEGLVRHCLLRYLDEKSTTT